MSEKDATMLNKRRITLMLVGGAVGFLIFGDRTSSLYMPQVALVCCNGPVIVLVCTLVLAFDRATSKQYERNARRRGIAGVQVCQHCGSMAVVGGMCTVCDVEVGIL